MQVGESELTARGCDLFGSPGYRFCENGWVTFLMLMSTLYQYFMYLQIFTSFFLFSHCHSGHASDYVPPEREWASSVPARRTGPRNRPDPESHTTPLGFLRGPAWLMRLHLCMDRQCTLAPIC